MPDLDWLDHAAENDLRPRLLELTASPAWADQVLRGRPYSHLEALLDGSDEAVLALPEAEVDAALAGHPRIGERAAGPDTGLDAGTAARSAREQAGMDDADDDLKQQLAAGNAAYEARFGRIYLVAAAGRSAAEMVALLGERLTNDPTAELDVVRRELARITRLRLQDTLADPDPDHDRTAGDRG